MCSIVLAIKTQLKNLSVLGAKQVKHVGTQLSNLVQTRAPRKSVGTYYQTTKN